MTQQTPNRPPEVNETAIRLKSGLKKALIFGAIGLAAAIGIGFFAVGLKGAAIGGVADYLFGTSILKTGGMIGLGIPLVAAGAGFLMGATDDKPILQARADARREWMSSRSADMENARMAGMAHDQAQENERHREALGMGRPGGFTPPSFAGGGGGARNRGAGLFGA